MRLSEKLTTPVLTDSLKTILSSIASSRTMPACIIQRAKIALLSAMGKQNKEISAEVGLHINNVGKWRMRFVREVGRLAVVETDDPAKLETELRSVLCDRPRSGAKQTFTANQRTFIITVACHDPKEYGYELSHWSLSALRSAILSKGIVEEISVASISRILNEHEIRPHKIQYWLHSTEKADDHKTTRQR